MKNIVLMMLVAMLPFLTMAQKRSKKGKNVKTEKIVESNASYEFMIITGYEVSKEDNNYGNRSGNPEIKIKEMMKSNSRLRIMFDFGRIKTKTVSNLKENAETFRTMAAAVNAAANEGWYFVSSDVVLSGSSKIHYYYMKRDK